MPLRLRRVLTISLVLVGVAAAWAVATASAGQGVSDSRVARPAPKHPRCAHLMRVERRGAKARRAARLCRRRAAKRRQRVERARPPFATAPLGTPTSPPASLELPSPPLAEGLPPDDLAPHEPPPASPPPPSNAVVVKVVAGKTYYRLDPATDYVVAMPVGGFPTGGLVIDGGRDVRLAGGHITVPADAPLGPTIGPRRGLALTNQRGTVHVSGLRIDGPGLSEGIQLDQRYGSTVVLEDIYVGPIHAQDEVGFTDNHPDVVQTWAGPKRLVIDGLSGTSDYQGLMLAPLARCDTLECQPSTIPGESWEVRHVDITGTATARVLLWLGGDFPVVQEDIWAKPAPGRSWAASVYPSPLAWPGATAGSPPAPMASPDGAPQLLGP